jgi:oligoribonuclease
VTARVAFDGTPTDRACREACAAVRRAHGAFVALVVAGSRCAAELPKHAAASVYAPDEPRDADAVVTFAADGTWTITEEKGHATVTQTHQFLWLDLETTGLDPASGVPLEFAAVLCEDARGDDFRVVQSFTSAIHHEVDALDALRIDRTILDMHAANGLWKDVQLASVSVADVDAFLAALAADLTGGRERAVRLAGSSVHFDLAWCRVHFPTFARYLSHRVLDVTTLRAAVDAWAPAPVAWPKRDAHRALADIMASIAEARVARAAMFAGGAS